MNREVGQLGVELVNPHSKKKSSGMLSFLIGHIHPYPLIHLGSAWTIKFPGRLLLGPQFVSSETGRGRAFQSVDGPIVLFQAKVAGPSSWGNGAMKEEI